MAQILDGKKLSQAILDEITSQVDELRAARRRTPHLAAVLVGNDPASETYVSHKMRACKMVGFQSTMLRYSPDMSEASLLKKLDVLNRDPEIDGYIVQLPLPAHIDPDRVIDYVNPAKDVDGFHPYNAGLMLQNRATLLPATPAGIVEMLRRYVVETKGKHCVVVGRSNIVGTPVSVLLSRNSEPGNCTVTLCHSHTADLKSFTRQADILIVAAGKQGLITADHVREGAVVVDVGMHRIADETKKSGFRLAGDVLYDEVAPRCSAITPVPGGVGPMTIAMLLQNTMRAYMLQAGNNGE